MTFAGPVGKSPAGRTSLDRRITRAGIFAGAGVLAALNAQTDQLLIDLTFKDMPNFVLELGGISAIIWFAMFAALKIGLEADSEPISRRDAAVVALVIFLCFVPFSFAGKAAVLLSGIYLVTTSRPHSSLWRIALIMLALSGPLVWGRALLNVFTTPILDLDAHIVGTIIGSDVQGNLLTGTAKNFFIGGPCSSVHNMSIAIVLWTTAAALFNLRLDWRYAGIGIAMIAWMFLLNIARLASLGLFPSHFDYIHAGGGAVLFSWVGLIGIALLAGIGVLHAVERQQ